MWAVTLTEAYTDYTHVNWPSTNTTQTLGRANVQTPTERKNTRSPDRTKTGIQIQTNEFSSTEHWCMATLRGKALEVKTKLKHPF